MFILMHEAYFYHTLLHFVVGCRLSLSSSKCRPISLVIWSTLRFVTVFAFCRRCNYDVWCSIHTHTVTDVFIYRINLRVYFCQFCGGFNVSHKAIASHTHTYSKSNFIPPLQITTTAATTKNNFVPCSSSIFRKCTQRKPRSSLHYITWHGLAWHSMTTITQRSWDLISPNKCQK